jgi:hypothetical protein
VSRADIEALLETGQAALDAGAADAAITAITARTQRWLRRAVSLAGDELEERAWTRA